MKPLFITGIGSISALGASQAEVRSSYLENSKTDRELSGVPVFPLSAKSEDTLSRWSESQCLGDIHLDRVSRLGLFASSQAITDAGWSSEHVSNAPVCVGTARGATTTIEELYSLFQIEGRVPPYTSPMTTLGGIATTIASLLGSTEVSVGTSMACASFMQSLLVSSALIEAGRSNRAIVCGAEAPLTPFTIAQMKALRIYSPIVDSFPCRPIAKSPHAANTMVLGEGAACFTIEDDSSLNETGARPKAKLIGLGFAKETTSTATGMEPNGEGLYQSMQRALSDAGVDDIDALVLHAPGTKLGNIAELEAVRRLFPTSPGLFSTKHLTGHTFGASGALSLELGIMLLHGQDYPSFPYEISVENKRCKKIESVMINAAGFGGIITSAVIGVVD